MVITRNERLNLLFDICNKRKKLQKKFVYFIAVTHYKKQSFSTLYTI